MEKIDFQSQQEEMRMNREMDLRSKVIMTFGFLRGLASTLAPEKRHRIEEFCKMMRFQDLLDHSQTKEEIQK